MLIFGLFCTLEQIKFTLKLEVHTVELGICPTAAECCV